MWGRVDVGDRQRVVEPWGSETAWILPRGGLHQAWHYIVRVHLIELELVILDSFSVRPACIVCC